MDTSPAIKPTRDVRAEPLTEIEQRILEALRQIRFGSLEIVIHDSRVVQIERSEKQRFDLKGKVVANSLS